MAIRGRERNRLEESLEQRRETREVVVGGFAEIAGKTYPLKNWSPNGFCIGSADLTPEPGDRLDIGFTIPLPDQTLTFQCRTGVMRHDPENQEIGGVFFNMPEDVQAVVEEHFDIQAPKGYGMALFERLRTAVDASITSNSASYNATRDKVMDTEPVTNSDPRAAAADKLAEGSEEVRGYRDAAEKGSADSQAVLGLLCLIGEEVPQDYVQAQLWLNLAAAQGHEEAVKGLEIVAELISPEQLEEAQHLTREWQMQQKAK